MQAVAGHAFVGFWAIALSLSSLGLASHGWQCSLLTLQDLRMKTNAQNFHDQQFTDWLDNLGTCFNIGLVCFVSWDPFNQLLAENGFNLTVEF